MSGYYTNGIAQIDLARGVLGTDRVIIETGAGQGLNPQTAWATVTQLNAPALLMADEETRSEGPDLELDVKDKSAFLVKLASPTTKLKFLNPTPGQRVRLEVKQDGTGSRKMTFEDVMWAGGTPPVLSTTADVLDIVDFTYHGRLKKWLGVPVGKAWADPEGKLEPETKDEPKLGDNDKPEATLMPAPSPGPGLRT